MTLLADFQIKKAIADGDLVIHPLVDEMVQSASVDVQLGERLRWYLPDEQPLDPYQDVTAREAGHATLAPTLPYVLMPGRFVLGATRQWVQLPDDIAGRVEGKSSLGRRGLVIHSTAGFIDPGFKGNVTLEIANLNCRPILLRLDMWIAQLSFYRVQSVDRAYGSDELGSHYQGSVGTRLPDALKIPTVEWE